MSPHTFVIVAATLAAAAPLRSQPLPDTPPVDGAALIKELKQIRDRQTNARRERFEKLAVLLTDAAKSNDGAARYFSDAVREADYSGATGDTYKFQTWREKNKNLLTKDKAFATAARLHLRYLVISLNRAATPDGPPPLRDLWNYVVALGDANLEFGKDLTASDEAKTLLTKPLAESPIARANLLQPELERLKDWEMVAGSLDGILDKDIRGPLRAMKDPRLLDTWKLQIDAWRRAVEKSRSDVGKATFEQVDLPRLYWGQARDVVLLGQKNRGIGDMVALVRQNPTHPDLPGWVEELTKLLEVPRAAPAPKP